MSLVEKIRALVEAFRQARVSFGVGGALALSYYVESPRTTADIDVNVAVPVADARSVLEALPDGIVWGASDVESIYRTGQVRLFWRDDRTPVDLFFPQADFHHEVQRDVSEKRLADFSIPVISARHLAVLKALFDRPKDWVDIQSMVDSRAVVSEEVAAALEHLLGTDARTDRVRHMTPEERSMPNINWSDLGPSAPD